MTHLIYNPRTRTIMRSRNVTFDEQWLGILSPSRRPDSGEESTPNGRIGSIENYSTSARTTSNDRIVSSCQNEHTRASILRSKNRVTFNDENSTTSQSIDRQRDKILEADDNHGSDGKPVSRPFQQAQAAERALPIDNEAARTTRSKSRAAAELH